MELDIFRPIKKNKNENKNIKFSDPEKKGFRIKNKNIVPSDYELDNFKIKTKHSGRSRTFTKKPRKKSIVHDNYEIDKRNLVDVSEKITNNVRSINHILSDDSGKINNIKEPAYLSQFDVQTFDAIGSPSAPNDIYFTNDRAKLLDLERKISYDGGWTQYNDNTMTYNVIPDDQLGHNNMTPSFSTKYGYGTNDLDNNNNVMNFKNDLFTGNMRDTYREKQENVPLFSPMANLSYICGTPNRTDEEMERCTVGKYRQNESIFEPVRVTPGVGIGMNEVGTHGHHSMYRDLGKTIDELRVKPKVTFEGRVIEGQRGQARPLQAPVIQYRPETFKTNTDDDLLPISSLVHGPKTRDNFIMKETDRSHQHVEYTGGAYVSQDTVGRNVPEYMRPKIRCSTRQNFTLPKPLQKFSRAESVYNPNHGSYNLPATTKDQNIQNNHIGIMGTVPGSSTYTNITDAIKATLKEITASQPVVHTYMAPNTMRGTVHPMDIANPTIKETTCINRLNPHATSLSEGPRTYFSDIAKTTMKEIASEPIVAANIGQNINLYADLMDSIKTTTKETMVTVPYQTNVTPIDQQQRAPDPQDIARTTNKETLVSIPYQTTLLPVNQQQRAPDPQDVMRTTNKDTLVSIPYQTMVLPVNQQQRAPDPQDMMRTTNKETLVSIPYQTMLVPINQQQRAPDPQDIMRTTNREILIAKPCQTNIVPVNQHQRAPNPQDIMKTTGRETLINIPYQTYITPVNQHQRAPDPQNIMRTTNKETLVTIPYQSNLTPVNQSQRAPNYQDITKTTNKEISVSVPQQTMITPINQHQRAPHPQDNFRTTTKEQSVQTPWNTFILPVNQQQRAPDPQDIMKTTGREILVTIPHQTVITPVNQQQRAQNQDIMRTTNKEISITIPYQTNITPVNQQQRAPGPQDTLKTTNKEITDNIPYHMYITGVNQLQGPTSVFDKTPLKATSKQITIQIPYNTNIASINQQGTSSTFDRSPLKTTAKESVSEIPCNTHVLAVGQAQRAPNPQDAIRTTNKEQMVAIPHNTHVLAVGQSQRAPNPQDTLRTTIKEQIIQIPYNTHVVSANMSSDNASTYNRNPLKATSKEMIINNKYITPLNGENRHRSYGDAYNITINDKKESVLQYRSPTNCGVSVGPDPATINMHLKSDNNISHGPIIGCTVNNNLDRPQALSTTKINNSIPSNRFIDPVLLKQLENNPFNLPIYSN